MKQHSGLHMPKSAFGIPSHSVQIECGDEVDASPSRLWLPEQRPSWKPLACCSPEPCPPTLPEAKPIGNPIFLSNGDHVPPADGTGGPRLGSMRGANLANVVASSPRDEPDEDGVRRFVSDPGAGSSQETRRPVAMGKPLMNLAARNSATADGELQRRISTPGDAYSARRPLKNLVASTHWCGGAPVTLHVYDLSSQTKRLGLPLYHLAVEVYSNEYFYSCRGLNRCSPAGNKGHIHRETVAMGQTPLRVEQVYALLSTMAVQWDGKDYMIVGHNCQNFADAFIRELGLDPSALQKYCRLADIAGKWTGGAIEKLLRRSMFASVGTSVGIVSSGHQPPR